MQDEALDREKIARILTVEGRVQGVGFRPFIFQLARKLSITGFVRNKGANVEVFAEGDVNHIAHMIERIKDFSPILAKVLSLSVEVADVNPRIHTFTINESLPDEDFPGKNFGFSIQDYALCDTCLSEFNDPENRRFHYAFISCTQCGPRYSILKDLPFDRGNTSYESLDLCQQCREEYSDPNNRRFHAQNIGCLSCGPTLTVSKKHSLSPTKRSVFEFCQESLLKGGVLCLKGVGGYRLYCDATNERAIAKLRRLKQRPEKPLALMILTIDDIRLSDEEKDQLMHESRPIVLIDKRQTSWDSFASTVSPGLNTLGIMLPATGVEHLLLKLIDRPLVATSANVSGGQVITQESVVEMKLSSDNTFFVHHNLAIQQGNDDSLFNGLSPLRLGRGHQPAEFALPFYLNKPVIAMGGQMKNTFIMAWENKAMMSPHLGNMDDVDIWQHWLMLSDYYQQLQGIFPQHYLVDAHPSYTSTQWVKEKTLSYTPIFHHHAHASALAFEHNYFSSMLVFTWDGQGYGADGTLWGGETFFGTPGHWVHASTIRPFKLLGSALAITSPWRIAASLSWACNQNYDYQSTHLLGLRQLWDEGVNSPLTSSIGRLFDAAAVYLGLVDEVSYDGQAAMILETVARDDTTDYIDLPVQQNGDAIFQADWEPLLKPLQDANLSLRYRATFFHNTLAQMILKKTRLVCQQNALTHVGLTGGVFQNKLLTEKAKVLLEDAGFIVLINQRFPANDASISLGQVVEFGMTNGSRD